LQSSIFSLYTVASTKKHPEQSDDRPSQIYVSKKWGFTKWDREVYEKMRAEGRLRPDGANVKYLPEHGPLSEWCKVQAEIAGV
jgi:hypothetical protein